MSAKPIKRSKHLVNLSRDHHEGLLIVWKIRQGFRLDISPDRIINFVRYAFDTHLKEHFREEEELLFNKMNSDELVAKAVEQHANIRELVTELTTKPGQAAAQLEAFANQLEEHIRFEERILFTHLEQSLAAAVLAKIGLELGELHCSQPPLTSKDEFWLNK
jgi:hemerythrin-like domain-containing protein